MTDSPVDIPMRTTPLIALGPSAALALLLGLLPALAWPFLLGEAQDHGKEEAASPAQEYTVWKGIHPVFATPYTFSRVLKRARKGEILAVVATGERWSRVRAPGLEEVGWAVLDAPPGGAGERRPGLGGDASASSLALALKGAMEGFLMLIESHVRTEPKVEMALAEIQDSYLELEDLRQFAASGGLKVLTP